MTDKLIKDFQEIAIGNFNAHCRENGIPRTTHNLLKYLVQYQVISGPSARQYATKNRFEEGRKRQEASLKLCEQICEDYAMQTSMVYRIAGNHARFAKRGDVNLI